MKIKLTMDESYRIFIVPNDDSFGLKVDVPEELIARFNRAEQEFREVEEELHKLYKIVEEKTR